MWSESHLGMSDSLLQPARFLCPWNSPGQNARMESCSFSRRSSQARDRDPVSCIALDFLLSEHQGSPRILEWVAYPFSRGTSWLRNRTGVSYIAGGLFISWATRNPTANAMRLKLTLWFSHSPKCVPPADFLTVHFQRSRQKTLLSTLTSLILYQNLLIFIFLFGFSRLYLPYQSQYVCLLELCNKFMVSMLSLTQGYLQVCTIKSKAFSDFRTHVK